MKKIRFEKLFGEDVAGRLLLGGIAGLLGGIVFGIWMAEHGVLAKIASMAGSSSPALGMVMHLGLSVQIGASFALIFDRVAKSAVPATLWGIVYGFIWWILGPLTMMPLMMGMGLQWSAAAVASTIPSLIWHMVFGGILGISYEALRREPLAALLGQE